jgi:hypothetical protein
MRKTYFFMAFWALAFGISGCGDITCKSGESYCNDSKTRMVCTPNGDLNLENCSAGCDFNTGKCKYNPDLKPDCQDNTYKCGIVADQAVSQQCFGGNWINVACENGCDVATGQCKDKQNQPGTSTCTHGEYQCDANFSYVCRNGEWGIDEFCQNGCDADTGKCNMKYIPGEACTKDTYTPSCSADKLNGYYCGSYGTVVTVSCPNANCVNNNGYIKCDDGNSGGSGEACTGNFVTFGGVENDCCDQVTYTPRGCDATTNTGLFCSAIGKVKTWRCPPASEPTRTKCVFDPFSIKYPGGEYSCVAP